ncbi:hypothetical protein MMPV_001523 [Pyropia vietnamensis]
MAFIPTLPNARSRSVSRSAVCMGTPPPASSIPPTPPISPTVADGSRRSVLLSLLAAPLAAAVTAPAPARADRTAAATRVATDRYLPRLKEAAATMRTIRDAVEAGDMAAAKAAIEDKVFNVKVRNALVLYAGVFSDNYVSSRTAAMQSDVQRMYEALGKVKAGGADAPEEMEQAIKAYMAYGRRGLLPKEVTDALSLKRVQLARTAGLVGVA